MVKCSFCRKVIEQGTGLLLVKNDGRLLYFCSRKCEKILTVRGRIPRETKWSKAFVKGVAAKDDSVEVKTEKQ